MLFTRYVQEWKQERKKLEGVLRASTAGRRRAVRQDQCISYKWMVVPQWILFMCTTDKLTTAWFNFQKEIAKQILSIGNSLFTRNWINTNKDPIKMQPLEQGANGELN